MKKILFISHTMRGGGVEKVLVNLLNKIDFTQNEVTLLLLRKEGSFLKHLPASVTVKYLATGNDHYRGTWLFSVARKILRQMKFKLYFRFPGLIRIYVLRETFDTEVVFVEDMAPLWSRIQRNESKTIGWVHTIPYRKNEEKTRYEAIEALRNFDQIAFVSNQARNACIQLVPELESKSIVINNPVNKNEVLALSKHVIDWPYLVPVFVSVGRLSSIKGFAALANVHLRLLKEGFAHFIVIVGEGHDRGSLEGTIDRLGIQKTFILQGFEENPYPFIKQADFFVLNSNTEGFGIVVAEAKILGKPIIATSVGGISDTLTHGETALLIPAGNETALYSAMKKLLDNPGIGAKLSHNCLKDSEQYDESKLYQQMLSLL